MKFYLGFHHPHQLAHAARLEVARFALRALVAPR